MTTPPEDLDAKPTNYQQTAELANGTWSRWFEELGVGYLNQKTYLEALDTFDRFYGDFHEKFLNPDEGPLLELGVGSGLSALPLISRRFRVVGTDNDPEALIMCQSNADKFSNHPDNLTLVNTDLYDPNWHQQFIRQGIQAVVSYGFLEHFTERDFTQLFTQQLEITPKIIAMVPVKTPRTLKAFDAEGKPDGDIDNRGIFRLFKSHGYWKREIFEKNRCQVIKHKHFSNSDPSMGTWDMTIFALERQATSS